MIIALLTDFGLEDNFVGVVKGVILGINPEVKIVDVSHSVMPSDILQAAFLLKSSYRYFPHGTIHLVVVDPGVGSGRKAVIVKTKRFYFIGPDNGVLSLALASEERVVNIVSITNQRFFLKSVSPTFHARDIFAPVAAHLSSGRNITQFGIVQKDYRHLELPRPEIITPRRDTAFSRKNKILRGEIIYIDRFGNLITNIEKNIFSRFTGKGDFAIHFKNKAINKISKSYSEAGENKPLAIFGGFGNLEISINKRSARGYFRARTGQGVEVFLHRT
ncbi:MAG: SAM-dependent chlorinase/fluorinase [Candidatus Omnitrophica bacterium]|nr:SAM-dependent chlorinase/fluorinase [Candidatus Omnitrophota bacterium]